MKKLWGHFKTISIHKWKVTHLCFRCGLYKQGLKHDLSKYTWIEFSSGVKYYQGNRSPIEKEKEAKGYSLGWQHHKGRNPHHWEYWLDNDPNTKIKSIEMPLPYVVEMFCDRVAACMTYQKEHYRDDSALIYYNTSRSHLLIHPKTDALIVHLMQQLAEYGLDYTIAYIRNDILSS
ncbi:MAG: DUF5662 family protein [Breznakia sp.]